MKPPALSVVHFAIAATVILGAGCSSSLAVAPPVTERAAQSTIASPSDAVRVVGLLSLKGAEPGAWWAVTDDRGAVTRLETAAAEKLADFRQWQNRRVEVNGMRLATMLGISRLKVERVQLAR